MVLNIPTKRISPSVPSNHTSWNLNHICINIFVLRIQDLIQPHPPHIQHETKSNEKQTRHQIVFIAQSFLSTQSAWLSIQFFYFGVRRVTENLLPLLRASPFGARIVMVSSMVGQVEVHHEHSNPFASLTLYEYTVL